MNTNELKQIDAIIADLKQLQKYSSEEDYYRRCISLIKSIPDEMGAYILYCMKY
jgi:hypothetical protein